MSTRSSRHSQSSKSPEKKPSLALFSGDGENDVAHNGGDNGDLLLNGTTNDMDEDEPAHDEATTTATNNDDSTGTPPRTVVINAAAAAHQGGLDDPDSKVHPPKITFIIGRKRKAAANDDSGGGDQDDANTTASHTPEPPTTDNNSTTTNAAPSRDEQTTAATHIKPTITSALDETGVEAEEQHVDIDQTNPSTPANIAPDEPPTSAPTPLPAGATTTEAPTPSASTPVPDDKPKRAPRKRRKWLRKGEVDPDDPKAVAEQKARHALIDAAIVALDEQERQVLDGTHPQLVELWDELERRRNRLHQYSDVYIQEKLAELSRCHRNDLQHIRAQHYVSSNDQRGN